MLLLLLLLWGSNNRLLSLCQLHQKLPVLLLWLLEFWTFFLDHWVVTLTKTFCIKLWVLSNHCIFFNSVLNVLWYFKTVNAIPLANRHLEMLVWLYYWHTALFFAVSRALSVSWHHFLSKKKNCAVIIKQERKVLFNAITISRIFLVWILLKQKARRV